MLNRPRKPLVPRSAEHGRVLRIENAPVKRAEREAAVNLEKWNILKRKLVHAPKDQRWRNTFREIELLSTEITENRVIPLHADTIADVLLEIISEGTKDQKKEARAALKKIERFRSRILRP
ncbi:MAG: hypothetical protein Q7S92_06090 [Candidatus Diapherotrites archaeon]|nr:hypothetical protein [Candidatus Diapherotrites archaeon]